MERDDKGRYQLLDAGGELRVRAVQGHSGEALALGCSCAQPQLCRGLHRLDCLANTLSLPRSAAAQPAARASGRRPRAAADGGARHQPRKVRCVPAALPAPVGTAALGVTLLTAPSSPPCPLLPCTQLRAHPAGGGAAAHAPCTHPLCSRAAPPVRKRGSSSRLWAAASASATDCSSAPTPTATHSCLPHAGARTTGRACCCRSTCRPPSSPASRSAAPPMAWCSARAPSRCSL